MQTRTIEQNASAETERTFAIDDGTARARRIRLVNQRGWAIVWRNMVIGTRQRRPRCSSCLRCMRWCRRRGRRCGDRLLFGDRDRRAARRTHALSGQCALLADAIRAHRRARVAEHAAARAAVVAPREEAELDAANHAAAGGLVRHPALGAAECRWGRLWKRQQNEI